MLDLFGEEIKEEVKKPRPTILAPAPVAQAATNITVPWRPCTVQRLSKTTVMIINDDCADRFK